jgi:ribose transport system substrate-binding protein
MFLTTALLAAPQVLAEAHSASQIPTTGEVVEGAPFQFERDWGTFTLNERIAAKVRAGEEINYVFSYQASGIPLFSPQYAAGYEMGCEMGNAIYPMSCTAIAPVQNIG